MKGFTRYALKNLKSTGSVARSSKFLAKNLAKQIPSDARTVIELGAGDGIITKQLLAHMPENATLTAYEISEQLLPLLERIDHPRFKLRHGSAMEIIQDFAVDSVDCLVSCLPLALFPVEMKHELLSHIKAVLKPNGTFLQYQYWLSDKALIKEYFPHLKLNWVPLNIPPSFVYTGTKQSSVESVTEPKNQ
ncbi:class I SAM-dependent methyltransferase [Kangiella sediminilitoris]|uniref:Methyltransferase type 12 n=1 Tax=Kangiella sediminilitoris TaxID=1144748 RepID=A0A1B3BBW8_9GAMM|nr:methyltransferase domain-containing protein [Kangiella sediminilitoris]AOE50281.1 Methyltransferase type 12 [Kangiella sediminilitoris]